MATNAEMPTPQKMSCRVFLKALRRSVLTAWPVMKLVPIRPRTKLLNQRQYCFRTGVLVHLRMTEPPSVRPISWQGFCRIPTFSPFSTSTVGSRLWRKRASGSLVL